MRRKAINANKLLVALIMAGQGKGWDLFLYAFEGNRFLAFITMLKISTYILIVLVLDHQNCHPYFKALRLKALVASESMRTRICTV